MNRLSWLCAALVVGCAVVPGDTSSDADADTRIDRLGASADALPVQLPAELTGDGVFFIPGEDPQRPRLRFADGQVSLNETCMIRLGNKLNPKVPPLYLNGAPVGFC